MSGSRLHDAKDKTKQGSRAKGKLNASGSFRSELGFFHFYFSEFLKLSKQRPAPLFARQSRHNYTVRNQWTRDVFQRLGNDKATAGERLAITSKSLPLKSVTHSNEKTLIDICAANHFQAL